MDNWEILKEKINEQLKDIRHHSGISGNWNTCGRMYMEVLKMMNAIEKGKQNELVPHNCMWKTKEEIEDIMSDSAAK